MSSILQTLHQLHSSPNDEGRESAGTALREATAPDAGAGSAAPETRPETRTTGSQDGLCRRCGASIKGRRRNRFCSDKCRMATRRECDGLRRREAVARLKEAVVAVEGELSRGSGHVAE